MEILCCSFVHLSSLNFIPSLFNLKDSFIWGESDYSQEYWYNRVWDVFCLLDWTIEPFINGEATGWMICWRRSCCTESRPPNPTNFHASKNDSYLFFCCFRTSLSGNASFCKMFLINVWVMYRSALPSNLSSAISCSPTLQFPVREADEIHFRQKSPDPRRQWGNDRRIHAKLSQR